MKEDLEPTAWPLRLARPDDGPALEELIPLSVRALQAPYYSPAQMDAALGPVFGVDHQLIADGTYLLVENAGRIIACGGWSKRKAVCGGDRGRTGEDELIDPARDAARIRAFFVHPDFARRGIGRAILTACEQAILAHGFDRAELVATLAGEPLYAAFGYEVMERYELPMSEGLTLPVVRMGKRLKPGSTQDGRSRRARLAVFLTLMFQLAAAAFAASSNDLQFIDTSFENASPVWYEFAPDGTVDVHLLYDHERGSLNRAAGHFHFLLQARPGAKLTLEFKNLDNVWNGTHGSIARELKTAVISTDGREWKPVPLENVPTNRVRLTIEMPGPRLYVARVEPYRLSDLDRLLASIRRNPLVQISPIGKTVEGRELEIVRIGNPAAPHRVFLRARAHPWEAGGNWVVEGFIQRLLADDDTAKKFLARYCAYILPMANKDGVARGRTRFNAQGKDLNRNWDKPSDPQLAPENFALEQWLEGMIRAGQPPHLALELHNDGHGLLHISRPPGPELPRHLERMTTLEELLRKHTWFTEGSTKAAFRNSGTLGDGWLERYHLDAAVHEFNCNWIAGIKDYPSATHWKTYGTNLAPVFHEYFGAIKPR